MLNALVNHKKRMVIRYHMFGTYTPESRAELITCIKKLYYALNNGRYKK